MPIYEYSCDACGVEFDKLVRMGAPTPPCPECGAGDVRKLISAASFVLKGSGWYKDHYGLKSGGKGAGGKDAGGKSADAGASGGSDGGSTGGGDSTTSSAVA